MTTLTTIRFDGEQQLFEGVCFKKKPTGKQMATIRAKYCFFGQRQLLLRLNGGRYRWAYMWVKQSSDYSALHCEGESQTYHGLD